MKKSMKKAQSSPWVLIVPLVIAIAVVIGAAFLANTKTETKSKASFDPLARCTQFCSNNHIVSNTAACSLDCPGVIAGTKTCAAFCNENVKQNEAASVGKRMCESSCAGWFAYTPAPTSGARAGNCDNVCRRAGGDAKTQYATCSANCATVKSGAQTCGQAFRSMVLGEFYKQRCLNEFGQ